MKVIPKLSQDGFCFVVTRGAWPCRQYMMRSGDFRFLFAPFADENLARFDTPSDAIQEARRYYGQRTEIATWRG